MAPEVRSALLYLLSSVSHTLTSIFPPTPPIHQVLEHKPYSAKIDVYSFGIVLWVLYSRREPYTELKRQWGSVHLTRVWH